MEAKPVGGVTIDRCGACGGTWFDGDEVEHAIDVTTRGISRTEASSLRPTVARTQTVEPIRYLACVRCRERMARKQVAPRAGIIVDVCRDHGVWFDGGELEHFAEFVKSGGLEVLRVDGVVAAEMKRKAADTSLGPYPVPRTYDPHVDPFDPVGLDDLARLVRRAWRHVFR